MQYSDFNHMEIGKKTKDSFVAGQPRYCQSCGQESPKLIQVTTKNKVMDQWYFCQACKEKLNNKN